MDEVVESFPGMCEALRKERKGERRGREGRGGERRERGRKKKGE
jgi:hypothetical protein